MIELVSYKTQDERAAIIKAKEAKGLHMLYDNLTEMAFTDEPEPQLKESRNIIAEFDQLKAELISKGVING